MLSPISTVNKVVTLATGPGRSGLSWRRASGPQDRRRGRAGVADMSSLPTHSEPNAGPMVWGYPWIGLLYACPRVEGATRQG